MVTINKNTLLGFEAHGQNKTITQDRLNNFSGGLRKAPNWPKATIHTSLEFAKSCGAKTQLASGAMAEGYLVELMLDLFGEEWLWYGKMSLKFIAVITVGDKVLPKVMVSSKEQKENSIKFILDAWCENQNGEKVVVGEAMGLVPL